MERLIVELDRRIGRLDDPFQPPPPPPEQQLELALA
jgi:hypothetical protein